MVLVLGAEGGDADSGAEERPVADSAVVLVDHVSVHFLLRGEKLCFDSHVFK